MVDEDSQKCIALPEEVHLKGEQVGYSRHYDFKDVTRLILSSSKVIENFTHFFRKVPNLQELKLYPKTSEV